MYKIKEIVVLVLMLFTININVSAYETEAQPAGLTSDISYENIYVQVTQSLEGELSVIYTGLLGDYDNGKWNYINFGEIDHLTIVDFATMETEAIFIVPIPEPEENTMMYSSAYNLNTVDFSIDTQIELNGVQTAENGLRIINNADINCTFSVANNSSQLKSVTGILSTYTKSGTLYQVKTVETQIESGETEDIEIDYIFDSDNEHTARLMLWDTVSGMVPLKTNVEFSKNSGATAYYYDANNRLLKLDKTNGVSIEYTYDNNGNMLSKTVVREGE